MGESGAPLAILMPVGPDCAPAFVADTIASARHYLGGETPFLVIDNSGRGLVAEAVARDPMLETLVIDQPRGRLGALWTLLARGMRRLRARCDPEILLRIDTDALVTGADLIARARARFDADPSLAVLGAYRISATGAPRDFSSSANALARAAARNDPIGTLVAREIELAEAHGYTLGENVLGGVCLYHRRALDALAARGLLDDVDLARCGVSEDVLFGLFLRAAGLTLGEFAGPGEPLGAKWRGLPGTPGELVRQRRGAIHSVRGAGRNWDEPAIRAFFQGARAEPRVIPAAPRRAPRLAVVMPIAPDAAPAAVKDTVASVRTWLGRETPIVLAANLGAPPPESVRDGATALIERRAPHTTYGPLAVTLGLAFREAIARFDCEIAFRLDVDGLITGPGLAEAAAARFAGEPKLGLLGACAFASNGGRRDVAYPASILRAEASRDDALGNLLMALWIDARAHGYRDAEHANGCVSLIHRRALDAAIASDRLGHAAFESSRLGEDILLALVVRSLGFALGEFAGAGDPLGVKWRGLPFDPPTLHARRKAAIHSVRHFGETWREADIRAWFQGARAASATLNRPAL